MFYPKPLPENYFGMLEQLKAPGLSSKTPSVINEINEQVFMKAAQ